jgi:hypothetical protein
MSSILDWISGHKKTATERAEGILARCLKGADVSDEEMKFCLDALGEPELQKRHEAEEKRRRQERRRRKIPEELGVVETECVRLRQAIPATAVEIEKTHKKIEALERSLRESRDLLHRSVGEVEALRKEAAGLGLHIAENASLPPRPSQAPIPPSIPMAPKPAPDARSKWIPESPRQPAWPTVTGA